jgi:uncharacterized protein YndB with AHSA1/START domain
MGGYMSVFVLSAMLGGVVAAMAQEGRFFTKEVIVKAPQEEVWNAWSTTDGIKTFFAPGGDVRAEVGGPYEIWFMPDAPAGDRGADFMKVLAVEAPRMIAFTWNAPPSIPEIRKNGPWTRVTITLTPMGEAETKVTLVHDRILTGAEWDRYQDYFMKAWDWVLGNLQKRFVEGPMQWENR